MKVLVTGGTGFTGSHLCERLVGQGYQVRALVRDRNRLGFLQGINVEIALGDLCDSASLQSAVQGIDTVYHIAALFRQQGVKPALFHAINTEGVARLLTASVQSSVRRFIHCSTAGVHGHIAHPPGNEASPYNPGDIYQETKLEGEKIARRYMEERRIAVTIVRPTGIYGPRDLRFLKLFRSIYKRRFIMLGSGEVVFHLVYIDDLIDGIIRCGTQAQTVGQTYILGGNEYITLNRLVAMIAEEFHISSPRLRLPLWPVDVAGFACETLCGLIKIEPPLYRRRIDFFRKNRGFDISKAKRELGFQPAVSLREGIHRVARWYEENGYL